MKGLKKCFGVLLLFSITFLLSLNVFSEDTNAVDLSIDSAPTGRSWNFENSGGYCQSFETNSTTFSWQTTQGSGWCFFYPQNTNSLEINVDSIGTNYTIDIVEGNYYVLDFYTYTYNNQRPVTWNVTNYNDSYSLVSYKLDYTSSASDWCHSFFTDNNVANHFEYSYCANSNQTEPLKRQVQHWIATFKAKVSADRTVSIGRANEYNELFRIDFSTSAIRLGEVVEYGQSASEAMNQKDNEDRNNIESQSSEASGDADGSQADVEELGSNFADYVGGIATALGASPTDCEIRANFGIGNFDAGTVDLCELSLPQEFQIIGSILLIAFVVPLAWATLNKIIALIRSFQ